MKRRVAAGMVSALNLPDINLMRPPKRGCLRRCMKDVSWAWRIFGIRLTYDWNFSYEPESYHSCVRFPQP